MSTEVRCPFPSMSWMLRHGTRQITYHLNGWYQIIYVEFDGHESETLVQFNGQNLNSEQLRDFLSKLTVAFPKRES